MTTGLQAHVDSLADTRLCVNGDWMSRHLSAAKMGGFLSGYPAGAWIKGEIRRVAAIIGSYPAILPL